MSVLLFRVDERLIHGQVVVGWARSLNPRRIIVVDDELAGDPQEQSIYRTGLPDGIRADFWTERQAREELPAAVASREAAFVLTSSLGSMARIARNGVRIAEINVGGIHRREGRRRVLPYVSLDETDMRLIEELEKEGVRVIGQDVPTAPPVRLAERARG